MNKKDKKICSASFLKSIAVVRIQFDSPFTCKKLKFNIHELELEMDYDCI